MSSTRTTLFSRHGILAWVVLATGLLLVMLVWLSLREERARSAEAQFELHAREVVAAIEKRLRDHEQILLGGAGLFDANGEVTRAQWQHFVERLRLADNYPGIQGVGFSQAIPPARLAAHIDAIRAEGFPDFTVRPAGDRLLYTSIIYLEPFVGRNLAAFGYDMFSEPTRRMAMQSAVERNATSITGKVKLVQETHSNDQAGFLMYVPVFNRNLPQRTAEERWRALRGFVYSPYRAGDLMQGILGESDLLVDFTLHDGGSVAADALMHDTGDARANERIKPPRHSTIRHIQAYGHDWKLTLRSRPAFEARFSSPLDWLVPGMGAGISLSLFALTLSLLSRRQKAMAMAGDMMAKRAEFEERFHQLFLHTGQGVVIHQSDGRILDANPAAERILGMSLAQMKGASPMDPRWRTIHEDGSNFPARDYPAMVALREGHAVTGVVMGVWNPAESGWRWVSMDAYPRNEGIADQEQRIYSVFSDLTEQRAADLEARQSRKFLSDVLASASEVSIIATDPDGLITVFNRGAERLLGYSANEMVGKLTPAVLHVPEEVVARGHALGNQFGRPIEGFRVFVEMAERHGSETREWTYVHRDGHLIPVSLVVTPMREASGVITGYLGIAEDITQRKASERELRESEQRFRSMLETCPTAARIARAGGHDVIFSNRRYSELINVEPGQVSGLDPSAFYANPEDYADILLRLGKGEQIFDKLVELTIPGVGNKWTLASYLPIQYEGAAAVLGWFYDISDLKKIETALAEQAQHTQAILDNMVDGIITIDQKGIINSFNPAAERIFGYTVEEVLGQNIKMLMPSPHRDAHDGYLNHYQKTGEARIIGIGREVEGQRKDGELFPMELAIAEVSRHGKPMYVGMVRDITERKRMERMKSEFVSTVSHELRTPLTSISGALGLIVAGALGALPEQVQQMIAIAHKNSQRLTHLINDLLDMEKIAAGKLHFDLQPQMLMPLIEQALKENQAYGVARRVALSLTADAPEAVVRVDAQRLMQVLGNLLSNAIKYSPEDETVEVAVVVSAGKARVTVADHGPGIPASFRSHIFQKFAQADSSDTRQKGGTGLGLAITRELVERMGGQIGFDSKEGQGSRFHFELPLWNVPASTSDTPLLAANAPRILVVEDDPDVAYLLHLMLTGSGYAVDTVSNGTAALEALQQSRYAAMTLDLMLPDISGLDIINQVRQQPETAELPIIVVSAKMEEGRLAINGDFAGIDWLAKPINEARMLDMLERQLSRVGAARPRVLHVEDDAELHQVVKAMVADRFDFDLATTLGEALARVAQEHFDMVILDLGLPDGSGWDLLPEIRARLPDARVVVLSGTDMPPEVSRRVEAVLLKSQISPRQLLDALSSRIQPKIQGDRA
jgi:PAS domain S-box-containing protein